MAVISFSDKPEQTWCVAGWAFRHVMNDVLSEYPDDAEMAAAFEQADALSGLIVYMLEPQLAARITNAITHVVQGILNGTMQSGIHRQDYSGGNTVPEYRKGLQELLDAIPKNPL
jgi:hypothetical protein